MVILLPLAGALTFSKAHLPYTTQICLADQPSGTGLLSHLQEICLNLFFLHILLVCLVFSFFLDLFFHPSEFADLWNFFSAGVDPS